MLRQALLAASIQRAAPARGSGSFRANRGSRAASYSAGLVGLPNVGKSTLFNALVRASKAEACNRPFTTIEPNVASVPVPDARLAALAKAAGSARLVPMTTEFHDIAGLIRGAAGGAGLGNAFLADIRATSVLVQVVRCFASSDVTHVEESLDPVRDISILEQELLLADLQSAERRLERKPPARAGAAGAAAHALLRRAADALAEGRPARSLAPTLSREEAGLWPALQLLTQKPQLFVCNVSEEDLRGGGTGNAMVAAVSAALAARADGALPPLIVSAQVEAEAAQLADGDRSELLGEYGLSATGIDAVVRAAAAATGLHPFYTVGPQEAHAWAIRVGATAVDAARAIHGDIADGFIKAEVCAADDFIAAGGEAAAREAHLYKTQGRDYVMREGEVAVFKHK